MRGNIGKMYAYHFFTGLHFIAGVLVPFFTEWGGISFSRITFLQAWFVLWVFIFEIPTGALADRFGRKVSVILSCAVFVAGALVYTSTPHFGVFMAGEFLLALSVALFSGAGGALIYDTLKEEGREAESKKVLGKFASFQMLGLLVGAPIGSLIASFIGLREVMLFMIVPVFCALVIALTLREPLKRNRPESTSYRRVLVEGAKYFYSNRTVKILAFDQISIGVPIFFMIWIYQLVLKEIGIPVIYFGLVHAGIVAVEIFCMSNFLLLERIFRSSKRYLLMSAVIPGLGLVLLAFVHWTPLVILLIIFVIGLGLPRSALLANYMHKHIDSDKRATVMSSVNMAKGGVEAALYPVVGLLVDWSVWYSIFVIGILVLGAACVSRVRDEHLIS
ncbi:MAG: MFS transporter [Candidatus Spechtbacterales bacterium]